MAGIFIYLLPLKGIPSLKVFFLTEINSRPEKWLICEGKAGC